MFADAALAGRIEGVDVRRAVAVFGAIKEDRTVGEVLGAMNRSGDDVDGGGMCGGNAQLNADGMGGCVEAAGVDGDDVSL